VAAADEFFFKLSLQCALGFGGNPGFCCSFSQAEEASTIRLEDPVRRFGSTNRFEREDVHLFRSTPKFERAGAE